jgi:O-antigen ligase
MPAPTSGLTVTWRAPRLDGALREGGTTVVVVVGLTAALTAALTEGWPRPLAIAVMTLAILAGAWRYPVYGVLAIVFLTSQVVPINSVDLRLPMGGGVKLPDLLLVGMSAVVIARELTARRLVVPWWPVTLPLMTFLGLAGVSAIYSLLYQGVEPNWALGELGALAYYGVALLTAWILRTARDRQILLVGLFLIADVTAALSIGQQFVGPRPLLSVMAGPEWHVWAERTQGGSMGGVRVVPPAHVLMHLMMLIAFVGIWARAISRRWRLFCACQFALLSTGLVLAYTRAEWIAGAAVLVLILAVAAPRVAALGVGLAALVAAVALIGGAWSSRAEAWKTAPLVESIASRARSIFTVGATLESFSLQWRALEHEEALRSIAEHPLLGVGLGNRYREVSIAQDESHVTLRMAPDDRTKFTRYVHNSYAAIAVKMGVPALANFLVFCLAFLAVCAYSYRRLADDWGRSLLLATVGAFVGLLGWSAFHSNLVDEAGTCVVGLMVGLAARCGPLTGGIERGRRP